jgi:hypothetical protein
VGKTREKQEEVKTTKSAVHAFLVGEGGWGGGEREGTSIWLRIGRLGTPSYSKLIDEDFCVVSLKFIRDIINQQRFKNFSKS